jgi:subtilisin
MGRRSISLLNLALVASLVFAAMLSGSLIPSPVASGTASAPTAATGLASPESISRQVKQNRPQINKLKDGKAGRKQKNRKRDRSGPRAGSGRGVQDRYIVVLKASAGDSARVADAVAASSVDLSITQVYQHVFDGFAAVVPDDQLDEIRNDPQVEAVIPDQEIRADEQTLPTGINRIDADQNLTAKIDGNDNTIGVDVAVLDTGISLHPDLNVAGGVSCIDDTTSYADDNSHGTHVAGTIGARDNSVGVVGVAPGVRLWAVKVLNSDARGRWSDTICGLDWVAAHSKTIDVVNMSLGGVGSDSACSAKDPLHNAICRVVKSGIPVVVSAGNNSIDASKQIPAAYNEVITVSALADSDGLPGGVGDATAKGPDDSLASFSNFGADVDIAAPGVSILSTVPGGYAEGWGTSMAAPHVAGAAALYLAKHPRATPGEVKRHLRRNRKAISLPNDPDGISEGVLNVGPRK